MRRRRSRFWVLGSGFVFRFVLIAAAGLLIGVVSTGAIEAQTTPAAQGNTATGAAAYAKAGCETCHGPGGRGTAAGPALAGTARPLPAFAAYVRKPLGTMPPQNVQAVSDQVLADIYAFLRAAPPAAANAPGTSAVPPGRVDNGAVLYKKVGCYQCHSQEGQGGLSGPRIAPDPVPFARFVQYIRNPTGEMPPYSTRVLTDQEIADLFAWVNARPRPPAVSSLPQLAP
jgi:mono/diheme cytochrome c family protein